MLNPPGSNNPNMMGTLSQGMRASQDILLHVLRANAEVLDTTRDLLMKIADTLEKNRVDVTASASASRKAPEKVKVTAKAS